MAALTDIDRELDALGAPPPGIALLLARYGEADHALARTDAALDALGRGVVAPVAARRSADRIAVDLASVGTESDALPPALGEPLELDLPVEPEPPAEPRIPAALDPPASPARASHRAPDPNIVARFEALFTPAPEPAPAKKRESARPAGSRKDLGKLLDQAIDPSEFPRASDSVASDIEVVETASDTEADSGLEMLVDDDDILEIDDVDAEEIE